MKNNMKRKQITYGTCNQGNKNDCGIWVFTNIFMREIVLLLGWTTPDNDPSIDCPKIISLLAIAVTVYNCFIACACCHCFIACNDCKLFHRLQLIHKCFCVLQSFHRLQSLKAITLLTIVIVPLCPFY